MIENDKLGLIGAGGQADETESYVDTTRRVAFRAVDAQYVQPETAGNLIDIQNPSDEQKETPIVAAIGAPAVRRLLLETWPGETYTSVVSEHAIVDSSARIGEGTIIAPKAVITTNVEIGKHSIINIASTINHNSKIGNFVTVGPGVHIAGNVVIGDGVFIGIGASISNNIEIASGVVIGAGAVVIKSIEEENAVYAGVPAKKISQRTEWLHDI